MTANIAEVTRAQRANLKRYCQLLTTDLTDHEREYLHKRISETRRMIDDLEAGRSPATAAKPSLHLEAAA